MIRPLPLLLAATLASPALASPAPYVAALSTPVSSRAVVHDVAWTCAGATCTAPRAGTAPDAVMCAAVARKLGPLTAFTAGERAFGADELARCNGSAASR